MVQHSGKILKFQGFSQFNFNDRSTVLVTILVDKAIGVFAVPTVPMELHQLQEQVSIIQSMKKFMN